MTTKDTTITSLLVDNGITVDEFSIDEGAAFLMQMTPDRRCEDGDQETAESIARQLGGLPLALNQMAAIVNARNWSLKLFGGVYQHYDQSLHKQKESGSSYLGYKHTLDTVWVLSFQCFGSNAHACLSVLTFLAADSIPLELFKTKSFEDPPKSLTFCMDELWYVVKLKVAFDLM